MLNFLCAAAEEDLQAVLRVIVVFVALVIFILSMVKKGQRGGSTPPATNNGDETVYLKEVRYYGSMTGSISINKELTPGLSYSKSFKTSSLDWVF
ncbi:MAG: hypothetical protein J6Q55_02610, partial [Clostridia bacterium]|nr:hypothetical protein [Clostridia bacterium]